MNRDDCTKTPSVLRSSGTFVGGTMRRTGSRFLSARRVPYVFVDEKTEEGTRGKTDHGFRGVKRPIFPFTQGEEVGIALEQFREGVRALCVIVDVRRGTEVSLVREGPEYSRGGGTGNGARVHLAKHHPCGFYEPKRSVNGEEFAGGAEFQSVGVAHTKSVCIPIEGIPGQLGELIGAVCGGRERFLQLVIRHAVIATNPHATLCDGEVFGGVRGSFANDVGPRS